LSSHARWITAEARPHSSRLQESTMVRRRSKKEEENELAVREQLRRAWLRWHAEQLEQALAGIHGDVMRRLMAQLEDLRSARALVDLIAGQDWAAVGADTRAVALHEINKAITNACA